MVIRLGVATPTGLWNQPHHLQCSALARLADAGVDHVFCGDHLSFLDGRGSDALVHLGALSAMEPRLDLHIGVLQLGLRHPVLAARQIASLAEVAPGRVTVGVGVAGEDRREIELAEVDPATRGRRTDAALSIVRSLLAGKSVSGDGEFFGFEDATISPVPDPGVPFLVGGRSRAAVSRAGRLGDGWLARWCAPKTFQEGIARCESIGAERGTSWQHGIQMWAGVGATPEEGRRHVAEAMQDFYGLSFDLFERYTPTGDARHIAEFVAPYVRAGISILNLTPCGADREVELETIAEVRQLIGS